MKCTPSFCVCGRGNFLAIDWLTDKHKLIIRSIHQQWLAHTVTTVFNLIQTETVNCSFDDDEVRASFCAAGLALKMKEPDHLSFNGRSSADKPEARRDNTVTCYSYQVKNYLCGSYSLILRFSFNVLLSSGIFFTLQIVPVQAHLLSWVTQHPAPSSLLLPGNCPGVARKRTQSSWRTSWRNVKRISGELKESTFYLWKRSASLAASVTWT